jgi:hypothetical protein
MSDVVQELWGFCHTLRHDGIGYGDYIEQITCRLFLKMAHERGAGVLVQGNWVRHAVGREAGRTFGFPGVTGREMWGCGAASKRLAARWHHEVGMGAHYDRGLGRTGERYGRRAKKRRRSNTEHSRPNVQGTNDERHRERVSRSARVGGNPWHVNGSVAAGYVEGILLATRRRGLRIRWMKVERRILNNGP